MGLDFSKTGNPTLIYLMKKNRLNKKDISRLFGLSYPTIHNYINNPFMLNLKQLYQLAGLFHIDAELLLYMIGHNKRSLKDVDRMYVSDKIKMESKEFMDVLNDSLVSYDKDSKL